MAAVPWVTLTVSELASLRSCRMRWSLAYEQQLSPAGTSRPFAVGRAIHEGAALSYRVLRAIQRGGVGEEAIGEHGAAHRALVALLDDEGRAEHDAALSNLAPFVREDYDSQALVYEVERVFEVADGRSKVRLRGARDLVMREGNELVLHELKSTAGAACDHDARLDVDTQTRLYLAALAREYPGLGVGRVILTVVRKTRPRVPERTQKGLVSAAAIDTTRAIYAAALAEQGVEPTPKQLELLLGLPEDTTRWGARHEVAFTKRDLADAWADLCSDAGIVRQMRARGGEAPLRPTRNGSACTMPWSPPCSMRRACVMPELAAEPMLYRVRKHRHGELDGDELLPLVGEDVVR